MAKKIDIAGTLNAATTDGVLGFSEQIKDESKGKMQSSLNKEFGEGIERIERKSDIAYNAVKTLEGLSNANEAMQTLAGQVVQIEENKQNIASNKADADAKLTELGSKVNEVAKQVFLSKSDVKANYIANNGYTINNDENRCYCESFFGVSKKGTLVFENANGYQICILFYDKDKNILSTSWFSVKNYITIPDNVSFIRLSFGVNVSNFDGVGFICYDNLHRAIIKPYNSSSSYKIPNISTKGNEVTLELSASSALFVSNKEYVFSEGLNIPVNEENGSTLRYLIFDIEEEILKFVAVSKFVHVKNIILGSAISYKTSFIGAWFDFDFTVDGEVGSVVIRKNFNEQERVLKNQPKGFKEILEGFDVCNIECERWNNDGKETIETGSYKEYWHRSELIPLGWFDNYSRLGLKKKSGNGDITAFFFDSNKNFLSKGNGIGSKNIPKNAFYVSFNQYINTSDGSTRETVTFSNFGLFDVRTTLNQSVLDAVTDDIEVNKVVKELYLEGLDENSNYGILSLTKGDVSLYGDIYKIGEDETVNEGVVANFYSRDLSARIFEITPKNDSGISGYILINYDAIDEGSKSYYAKINIPRTKSMEYNPSIKSFLKSKEIQGVPLFTGRWDKKVVLVENGLFQTVSARWTVVKYYVEGLSKIKVTGIWDDNKSAAIAFYDKDGNYLKEHSVASVATKVPVLFEANVPQDAEYALTPCADMEPIIETSDISKTARQVSEEIFSLTKEKNTIKSNTLLSVAYPSIPNMMVYHLFIDKIYTRSKVTIPCQSIFDVFIAYKLGFKVIEVNTVLTSDGVHVTGHQVGTNILQTLTDLNGNEVELNISNITFDELRTNYRYKSEYPQYRVPITSLEEFLLECKKYDLTPYVQVKNKSTIDLTERIMGKRYIAYNGNRELTDVTIGEYRGGTIDELVARCKEIGAPYQLSVNTDLNNFSDNEIKELVARVHATGCWVSWAGSYHSEEQNQRFKKLGLDMYGSGWNVPDFEHGDEGFVYGNCIKGFDNFGGDYTNDNGIAKLSNGQSMSKWFEKKSVISKASLHIQFKGELGITFGKISSRFSSNGIEELVFTSIVEDEEPTLYLYAYGDVEVYSISYKVANVI